MRKSLVLGTLSLTMLVGLPACGDDAGTDTGSETGDGTGTGTGDGDGETSSDEGMSAEDTTGDGDGDTTTGDGDGDTTTGDGDGDTTTGDGDGDTTGDGDGDTTTGDGDGDATCYSTLVSTENTMTTNLQVEGIISCNQPIDIVANGGTVCVSDDGAGGEYFEVTSITFVDVPPIACGFAMLGLSNLSIAGNGDGTEVTIPAGGGDMTGNQPIVVNGEAYGNAPIIGTIDPTALDGFEGSLPQGTTAFATGATVSYADNSHVMATAMPDVSGVMLTVTLTGLTGSLTFDP